MSTNVKAEAERLKQDDDVASALEQTSTRKEGIRPVVEARDKLWFSGYLLLLIGLMALHYVVAIRVFGISDATVELLQRFTKGGILLILLLGLAKASEVYLLGRINDSPSRFNLRRIQKLVVTLAIVLIAVSLFFVNWYATIVSVGVISLILGFALQTPITSFIGWIYILARAPYRVGDRIQIGDATGDVIDVSYLDTTLWEFGGPYLPGESRTG